MTTKGFQSAIQFGINGKYDEMMSVWRQHNLERERCPFCKLMIHPTTRAKHMRISHPLGMVTGPGVACSFAEDGTRTTSAGGMVRVDRYDDLR